MARMRRGKPRSKATRNSLTHVDARGRVRMVDVGAKTPMHREAVAEGFFCAARETLDLLEGGKLPKGEALAAADEAEKASPPKTSDLFRSVIRCRWMRSTWSSNESRLIA